MHAGGAFEAFQVGSFASGSELGCLGSRSQFSSLIESLSSLVDAKSLGLSTGSKPPRPLHSLLAASSCQ